MLTICNILLFHCNKAKEPQCIVIRTFIACLFYLYFPKKPADFTWTVCFLGVGKCADSGSELSQVQLCCSALQSGKNRADDVRYWTHILECGRARQFSILIVNVSELSQWNANRLLTVIYSQGIYKIIFFEKTNELYPEPMRLVNLVSESRWWIIAEGLKKCL